MNDSPGKVAAQQLKMGLIVFFVLVVGFLVVVLLADRSIYTKTLQIAPTGHDTGLATLFLLGIVGFVALIVVGVLCQWRWIFWGLLLAFGASILEIPATILQFSGALPLLFPVWYSLARMGVAVIEVALAVWVGLIYRRHGVWAMGRKTPRSTKGEE